MSSVKRNFYLQQHKYSWLGMNEKIIESATLANPTVIKLNNVHSLNGRFLTNDQPTEPIPLIHTTTANGTTLCVMYYSACLPEFSAHCRLLLDPSLLCAEALPPFIAISGTSPLLSSSSSSSRSVRLPESTWCSAPVLYWVLVWLAASPSPPWYLLRWAVVSVVSLTGLHPSLSDPVL